MRVAYSLEVRRDGKWKLDRFYRTRAMARQVAKSLFYDRPTRIRKWKPC